MKALPPRTLLRFLRRFVEYRLGRRAPLICSFLVTGECNLTCAGCTYDGLFRGNETNRPELDTSGAMDVIRGFNGLGLPVMIFAGGEPLLRKDLFTLAGASRRMGMFNAVFTNGTLIGGAEAAAMDRVFHRILVSIDGSAEANDAVRGGGSYEKAAAGLKTLVSGGRRAKVIAACVVNRHNISSLGGFVSDMMALGADGVKFQANHLPEMQPDPAAATAGIAELIALKRKHPRFIKGTESFFRGMERRFAGGRSGGCFAVNAAHVIVSPSGEYSLCCYYPTALPEVKSPADLLKLPPERLKSAVSGCEGCFRYDEEVLGALFTRPMKANLREALENARG